MFTRTCLLLLSITAVASAQSGALPAPRNGGVYVAAHRGAHQGIPENTLAAYEKAIDLGADFVEIDVRQTKDGHYVSVHNETIDAYTADAEGPVRDFTLAELKAMDIGSRVDAKWRDERIPTLKEILALCKGRIGIYLDLKEGDAESILKIIREHDMEGNVLWYADEEALRTIATECSECWPMPDPGPEENLPALLERHRPRMVAAVWRHFSESFVSTCHQAGAKVIVDESDPSCWEQALAWGSDGIQTDHPEELINYLKARGDSNASPQSKE